jgi:hypothetical protein
MDKYSEISILKAVNAMHRDRDQELFLPTISNRNSIALAQKHKNKRLFKLKVVLPIIVILALTLTAIFIVKKQEIIGSSEKLIHNNEDIDDTDLYRNVSNKLNENKVEETIEKINSLTTTTIGPTTTKESVKPSTSTPQSTNPKEIDYILVTVIVNRATVPDEDIAFYAKTSDSFVDLYLDGTKIGSTHIIHDSENPHWNYPFPAHKMSIRSHIDFKIYDEDMASATLIGQLSVKISDLMAKGLNGKETRQDYGKGSLWYTVSWTEIYKN